MKTNIIAITDLEHSSPRIPNLLYYLDSKRYNKYIIGAEYDNFISKDDLPNKFEDEVTIISFKRNINFFKSIKATISKNKFENKQNRSTYLLLKKIFLKVFLNLLIPDQYVYTAFRYRKLFDKNFSNSSNTIIISSSPYPTSHIAAYLIKRKYENITWISDFRDLWSLNHAYNLSRFRLKIDSLIEKKIISKTDIITTVSAPWVEKMKILHNKKTELIRNGYSEIEFTKYNNPKLLNNKKINILYVGSLYFDFQDIDMLFNSIDNSSLAMIELHFIGNFSSELQEQIETKNLQNHIKQLGKFSRLESINMQSNYDYLLFFDFKNDDGVLLLKFYEYIYANKPIICIGSNTSTEHKKILRDMNRSIILENKNQIKHFFKNEIHSKKITVNKNKTTEYSYQNQSQKLDKVLQNFIK